MTKDLNVRMSVGVTCRVARYVDKEFRSNLVLLSQGGRAFRYAWSRIRMIMAFEVFTANVEMRLFWSVGPCSLVGICEGFAGTCCLYFANRRPIRWTKNNFMYDSIFLPQ